MRCRLAHEKSSISVIISHTLEHQDYQFFLHRWVGKSCQLILANMVARLPCLLDPMCPLCLRVGKASICSGLLDDR